MQEEWIRVGPGFSSIYMSPEEVGEARIRVLRMLLFRLGVVGYLDIKPRYAVWHQEERKYYGL